MNADSKLSYEEYVERLNKHHRERENQPSSHPRFANFQDRLEKTDLTEENIKQVMQGRDLMQWCGAVVLKHPFDYCIYQLVLQEIKPATIIEIGTFNGGWALWMADMVKAHSIKTHVYAMDYDLSNVQPIVQERKDITLIKGDCYKIEEALPDAMMKSLPHPWLVSEDAHVSIPKVLGHLHKFTQPGDYIVCEDTNPMMPNLLGYGLFKEVPYIPTGNSWTYEPFKEFMKSHGEHYRVDTGYTDLFGYNATWNYNSIIRRV